MGDKRRFIVTAEFVARNLTNKDARIADVAAGKGTLSFYLRNLGFRNIDCWEPAAPKNKGFIRRHFTLYDASRYDAIIGLHPDGATEEIISGCAKYGKMMFLVPCCAIPTVTNRYTDGHTILGYNNWSKWCDHLLKMCHKRGMDVQRTVLQFGGKNVMLWGRGKSWTVLHR